jgi:serine/threonine protein kinase
MMNTLELVPEEHDPLLGTQLCGRYRMDALLGRGAMGAVYRAWDLQRAAACAIKLLRVDSEVREAAGRRFADEGRLVRQIFHPNIVEIFDQGISEDGSLFLVMELLAGQDLDEVLSERRRLSLRQAQDIVYQIGSALHAVHQVGIVHRDIKPRNIFLLGPSVRGFEESPRVKVIDFGLAKYLEERHVNRGSDGMLIGTPEYLAPESWTGVSAHVDTRADQWALAVLAFRLLSGRLPFDSQLDTLRLGREIVSGTPRALRDLLPDVPEYVESALKRALAKEKHERFLSIRDFVWAFTARPLNPSTLFSGDTAIRPVPVEPTVGEDTRRLAIDARPAIAPATVLIEGEIASARSASAADEEADPASPTTRWVAQGTRHGSESDDGLPQTHAIALPTASSQTPAFARGLPAKPAMRTSLLFALHLMQVLLTLGLGLYVTLSVRPRSGTSAAESLTASAAGPAASPQAPALGQGSNPSVPQGAAVGDPRVGGAGGPASETATKAGSSAAPPSEGARPALAHPSDEKVPRKRPIPRARALRGWSNSLLAPSGELRPWPVPMLPLARRQRFSDRGSEPQIP